MDFGLLFINSGVVLFFFAGIVSAVLGYIKLAEENSGLFTLVLIGVGICLLLLICIYYVWFWKPETEDGKSVIFLPNFRNPVESQGVKEKRRKRVRLFARLGLVIILVIIPFLVWAGFAIYDYRVKLPPKDFIILVADFDGPKPKEYRVTETIIENLANATEEYSHVKIEPLKKSISNSDQAKKEGKLKKAEVVIWGWYGRTEEKVPISVKFRLLKSPPELPELGIEAKEQVRTLSVAQLENLELHTRLSEEMNYLSFITLGMYRYLDEDWKQAIKYFSEALNELEYTEEPISSLGQGYVYFYLGNSYAYSLLYKKALAEYEKALDFEPDFNLTWYNRGIALYELGRYEEAIASYDKTLRIKYKNDMAWNNRGNALYELERYEEAIDSYDKALEINYDSYHAWHNRGNALYELGLYKESINSYEKALGIKCDIHDASWNNRGNALGQLGRYEEAIVSYDKALELNSDDYKAWYNRGNALGQLRRYEEAIVSYDKALELKPDHNLALNNRGNVLGNLGRYKEAITSYDKALEFNPNFNYAWYNKAAIYALQNNIDLALKNLEQAISLNPELREYVKTDSDFDAIREDERFKELIEVQ